MKTAFCVLFCTIAILQVQAQNVLTRADECYDKKDYACAYVNYMQGYEQALYKPELKYLVEFRLGYCLTDAGRTKEAKAMYLQAIKSKSDYGYTWWNLGAALFKEKKYDSSAICYKKAAQFLPQQNDKDAVSYSAAESYFNNAIYTSAITEYKKVIRRDVKYRLTDLAIAEVFLKQLAYDSALFYAQRSATFIPATDSHYYLHQYDLGKIYRGKKEYDKAVQAFNIAESSIKKPAMIATIVWEKGLVYADKNDYDKSTVEYNKALPYYTKDSVNTRILLNNIVTNTRKKGDHTALINALNKQLVYSTDKGKQYKEIAFLQYAKPALQKEAVKTADLFLIQLGRGIDSNTYATKAVRARMMAIKGAVSLQAKDSARAIKEFSEATRHEYSQQLARLKLGDIYWNRDMPDSFKKHYDLLVMSYYNEDSVLYTKADIARSYARRAYVQYNYKGTKPNQIILDIENALKFDSLQKEAVYLWPVVLKEDYTLSTKREAALKLIEKGVTKFSTDKKYVSELYNVKAVLLDTKKDTAGVEKALNESVRIYPDNISAWQNLFTFCNAAGRQEKGITATDKLIAMLQKKGDSKTLAAALLYKGDFLWRLNKKEEAKKVYNEALVWDAENATAKERLKM